MSGIVNQLALFERGDPSPIDHSQTLYEHVWDRATEDCDEAELWDLRDANNRKIYAVPGDVGGWAIHDSVQMDGDVWPPPLFNTAEEAAATIPARNARVEKALDSLVKELIAEYRQMKGKIILRRFEYTNKRGKECVTATVPVRIRKPEHDRPDVCRVDPGTAFIVYEAEFVVSPLSLLNLLPVFNLNGPCHSIRPAERDKPFVIYDGRKRRPRINHKYSLQ